MNRKWLKPLSAAIVAAGVAFAQAPAPQPARPPAARQQRIQRHLQMLANYLNLTDAQKEQAKAALQEARHQVLPLVPQLKQNRQALAEAVKNNKPSQEIAKLAGSQGNLLGQMIAIRTEAFAKIYQTLTPEQRTKADQLREHLRGIFQQRLQNRG